MCVCNAPSSSLSLSFSPSLSPSLSVFILSLQVLAFVVDEHLGHPDIAQAVEAAVARLQEIRKKQVRGERALHYANQCFYVFS